MRLTVRSRLTAIVVAMAAVLLATTSHTPGAGASVVAQSLCPSAPVPLGALAPARPIWCESLPLPSGYSTFVQTPNAWLDDFEHRLSNADLGAGYRLFDQGSLARTAYFRHADHWMVDVSGIGSEGQTTYNLGGTMLRPDRSFRFETSRDGARRLVVEADVAAGIAGYGGAVWPELVVTTAPEPTTARRDALYAYDRFAGHSTLGCRLQANRQPICALFDDTTRGVTDGGRVFETSFFQNGKSDFGSGASVMWGGDATIQRQDGQGTLGDVWRRCSIEDPDVSCRDRFRWEIEKDRFVIYVNGVKYMEHAGFPAGQQLPEAMLDGEVYVYFASWISKPASPVSRFHWDRVAVNPDRISSSAYLAPASAEEAPAEPTAEQGVHSAH